MGASLSAMFMRGMGDAMLASTHAFLNVNVNAACTVESAAMRGAYIGLCVAYYADFTWSAEGHCATMAALQPFEASQLEAKARIIVQERLSQEDLFKFHIAVGDKVRSLHTQMIAAIRAARRRREEEGDDPSIGPWDSVVQNISDAIPIASHETLVELLAGMTRLASEEAMLRWPSFAGFCQDGYRTRFYAEQNAYDERCALLRGLMPHIARTLRDMGTQNAAERVIDEVVKLSAQVAKEDRARYEEAGEDRPLDAPSLTAARVMMAVAALELSDKDGDGVEVRASIQPIGKALEPDAQAARASLRRVLAAAFIAPYDDRAFCYVGGKAAATAIAREIVIKAVARMLQP
jgi:hypothetical protein